MNAHTQKIQKSLLRLSLAAALVVCIFVMNRIADTNALFTDRASVSQISFHAGVWIPTVTMVVTPEEPDGENGNYLEPPCVKIFADLDDVTIHYMFDGEDGSDHIVDEGVCIYPPEGVSVLSVYAVHNVRDTWKSDVVMREFSVMQKDLSGNVVINEIMWMGSADDDHDEWIELRNMTDTEIDLSGWQLTNIKKNARKDIVIPDGYHIDARGYFVIMGKGEKHTAIHIDKNVSEKRTYVRVPSMDIDDDGENIVLKDPGGDIIDEAWQDAMWPHGWHGIFLHMSMERVQSPGDGTKATQWRTCTSFRCNDKKYWEKEWLNFGTPGAENIFDDTDGVSYQKSIYEENIIEKLQKIDKPLHEIWKLHFSRNDEKNCEKDCAHVEVHDVPGNAAEIIERPVDRIIENEDINGSDI